MVPDFVPRTPVVPDVELAVGAAHAPAGTMLRAKMVAIMTVRKLLIRFTSFHLLWIETSQFAFIADLLGVPSMWDLPSLCADGRVRLEWVFW
jgi:hypothetical protein